MSTVPVTTQDLELETAELLPSRETLCVWKSHPASSNTTIVQQSDGNVSQTGGGILSPNVNVGLLNGSFDNIGGLL
jgi:hypothetical protein